MKTKSSRNHLRSISLIVILAVLLATIFVPLPAFAGQTAPPTLSAAYDAGADTITMEGTYQYAGLLNYPVVLEILRPDDSLLYFATEDLDDEYAFSLIVPVAPLSAGTYTVRMASYDGGEYTSTTFTVARRSSGSGSSAPLPPEPVVCNTDPGAYYNDIPGSMGWAAGAINCLTERSIVAGMGPGSYGPTLPIRRGDFILMLMNAYALDGEPAALFTDVPADSYYGNAIALARGLGIAAGDGERFRPLDALTRQDAMALLHRAMVKKGVALPEGTSADLAAFADQTEVAAYAAPAMASLVKKGIVQGDGTHLHPTAFLTRAEMAVLLWKSMQP